MCPLLRCKSVFLSKGDDNPLQETSERSVHPKPPAGVLVLSPQLSNAYNTHQATSIRGVPPGERFLISQEPILSFFFFFWCSEVGEVTRISGNSTRQRVYLSYLTSAATGTNSRSSVFCRCHNAFSNPVARGLARPPIINEIGEDEYSER